MAKQASMEVKISMPDLVGMVKQRLPSGTEVVVILGIVPTCSELMQTLDRPIDAAPFEYWELDAMNTMMKHDAHHDVLISAARVAKTFNNMKQTIGALERDKSQLEAALAKYSTELKQD